jgi:hypothetical protein
MNYQELHSSILTNYKNGNKLVPFIVGKPGGGKSTVARQIIHDLGIKPERVTEFNPSLRDPVDIMGVPDIHGPYVKWKASEEFYRIRDDGSDEPCALIIEELSDANQAMQNPLCRVILDRYAGELKLHKNLFVICTGNSTEHKSGASRMTTKLGNRMQTLNYDENLDAWCNWALESNIDITLIQFMRFKPNLLSDFDPNRSINPTPRSWEMVNYVDRTLPEHQYLAHVSGCVGAGPAVEYVAFKKIMDNLPNIDQCLLEPETCKIPTDMATLYAFCGAIASRATKDNFDRIVKITERLRPEFSVMLVNDAQKMKPEIKSTQSFTRWAVKNASVLL